MDTFFYFHFISVSLNLANIGVNFAHHFESFFKTYYSGNMLFIAKKISLYLLKFAKQSIDIVTFIKGAG